MKKTWRGLKEEIETETKRIWLEEPDELKKIRLGIYEPKAGAYGQYFTTWDFVNGMVRDLAMSPVTPILKLAEDPAFSLDHLKTMVPAFLLIYTEFLGYCGLKTLERFTNELIQVLDQLETKEDFIQLFSAYSMYCNKLQAWCIHYFPAGIGVLFPFKTREDVKELARLLG